jgi:hypothetical protein
MTKAKLEYEFTASTNNIGVTVFHPTTAPVEQIEVQQQQQGEGRLQR